MLSGRGRFTTLLRRRLDSQKLRLGAKLYLLV